MCGLTHSYHKLRAEHAKYQPQVNVLLFTNKICMALALKKAHIWPPAGLGPFLAGCPGLPWLLFPSQFQDALFYAAAAAESLQLCPTLCDPWTAAHQAPLSLGFSRQEHWSGLPFPSPMHESEKWKWSRSIVSDSYRLHGLQPTRLLHPWDFQGKSTGMGCHCLLQLCSIEAYIWPSYFSIFLIYINFCYMKQTTRLIKWIEGKKY